MAIIIIRDRRQEHLSLRLASTSSLPKVADLNTVRILQNSLFFLERSKFYHVFSGAERPEGRKDIVCLNPFIPAAVTPTRITTSHVSRKFLIFAMLKRQREKKDTDFNVTSSRYLMLIPKRRLISTDATQVRPGWPP